MEDFAGLGRMNSRIDAQAIVVVEAALVSPRRQRLASSISENLGESEFRDFTCLRVSLRDGAAGARIYSFDRDVPDAKSPQPRPQSRRAGLPRKPVLPSISRLARKRRRISSAEDPGNQEATSRRVAVLTSVGPGAAESSGKPTWELRASVTGRPKRLENQLSMAPLSLARRKT